MSIAIACLMMRQYLELKFVCILYSHHDVWKKYGLTYLDPDKHWPCRKYPMELDLTTWTTSRKKQQVPWAPLLGNNNLCPNDRWLKKRLDTTLNHMTIVPVGKKGDTDCCFIDGPIKSKQETIFSILVQGNMSCYVNNFGLIFVSNAGKIFVPNQIFMD